MPNDRKSLKGRVNVFLRDARTGDVLDERHIDNLVVDVGEAWVAQRMTATPATVNMEWIQLGLSTLAATGTDTALYESLSDPGTVGPLAGGAAPQKSTVGSTRSGATWQLTVDWGTALANTNGIEEAGIFGTSAFTGAIMLARTVFTAVNKTNNDTLQIQWQINVSDDGV